MGSHHHHVPGAAAGRRPLVGALVITLCVFVLQVIGALWTGSLALLFDSVHVLTDAAGLAMALGAVSLSVRPATPQRSWGFRRAEVIAALLQAAFLLAVGTYVVVEGVRRLISPEDVAAPEMIVFGAVGLAGNLAALVLLARHRAASFNLRAAFLEVLNDALGSVAVIAAAVVIALTGWMRADAVVALLIGALIIPRTLTLLRETIDVLLESTPVGIDLEEVRAHIARLPQVRDVHDLHITQIATGLPVLTAHIVVDDGCYRDGSAHAVLDQLQECVGQHFDVSIDHSTFQIEPLGHVPHETELSH
ncbi:cation diffusion facilitator family transporter [Arthrobacter sedimenti]|uniref:cation diffusion facilitator family transporter n=1 Tax=Arthrobacter sedimenti TaxID=2694931 RepID=UPI000B34E6E2|nr:cation diffusion facilitator family transporter [Arthrobacter sedimenti]OUM40310.1 cation transporter [Arthrobacter agilis]